MSDGCFQVNINGIPEDFGLKRAKQLLQEKLEDGSAVRSINYFRTSDGSLKKSVIVADLKSAEYVAKLLQDPIVEEEFKDSLHRLLLTKPRIKSVSVDHSDAPERHSQNRTDVDAAAERTTSPFRPGGRNRSHHAVPQTAGTSSMRQDRYEGSHVANVDLSEKRSLYVIQIPIHMYREDHMREHFERFGNVSRLFMPRGRSTRYAIVEYDTHESAQFALENAGDLRPLNTNLKITWSNRQAPPSDAGPSRRQPSGRPLRGRPPPGPAVDHFPMRRAQSEGNLQAREIQVVEDEPVSWTTICKRDKDWFAGPAKRCVLVQNIPRHVTNTRLRAYFENEQQSGGGPVNRMVPMVDGVLIEFKDNKAADNVCRQNDHEIDSAALRIFRKPIPSFCNDRFVIQGKFGNSSGVRELLELCDDTSDFTVEEHNEPDSYFVKYAKSIEIKKLTKLVERAALEMEPEIFQLCHTDCLLVEGLCRDVKDDVIKLVFMNKRKVNGGDVTAVKRKSTLDAAIVYFANFKDAQNVLEYSKQNSILVSGNEVQVSFCYGGLVKMQKDISRPSAKKAPSRRPKAKAPPPKQGRGVKAFGYVPECDHDVIDYIMRSSRTKDDLDDLFVNVAQLNLNKKKSSVRGSTGWVVNFQPKKTMSKNLQNDQGLFESECTSLLLQFLRKFDTQTCQLNNLKLKKIRGAYFWRDEEDFIQVDVSEDNAFPAFVRWSTAEGDTKITGYPHHVTSIIDWLKQCCSTDELVGKYNTEEFQFLTEFGIISDVKDMFPGTVEIKVDNEAQTLTFKGRSRKVAEAKEELQDKLQNLRTNKLPFLDEIQLTFLREVLLAGDSDVEKFIKQEFNEDKIKAVLRCDPDPVLYYYRPTDLKAAQKALELLLIKRSVEVERDYDSIVQGREWKKLEQNISSNNCRLYKDKRSSTFTLVGMASLVDQGYQQIVKHCSANVVKKKEVTLSYLFILLLKNFPKELEMDTYLKKVEWQISSLEGGKISLKGKAIDVAKATISLQKSFEIAATAQKSVQEPGMAAYFRGTKGEQFLQTTQTVSRCIVSLSADSTSSQPGAQSSHYQNTPTSPVMLHTATLPGTNVTVEVVKGDITANGSDAIVNTSNEDLQLRPAGISGSILNKGGATIKKEMDDEKWAHGGKLEAGKAVLTSGGQLPCKKIIHVCGPQWNLQSSWKASQCLTSCVTACLQLCDTYNLTSIAIPAISCGVFGGDGSTCVRLIVAAVVKYFHSNTSSCVRQVCLIELRQDAILNEFKNELAKNEATSSSVGIIGKLRQKLGFQGGPSVSLPPTGKIQPSPSPHVSVLQLDIASVTADVIVTCTAPGNFASGQGSATSKALFRKTGQQLQASCLQLASTSNLTPGSVLETPGHNVCKKIYHVLLDKYHGNVGNGALFSQAIQKCLVMAESSRYSRIAFPAIGTGGLGYPADSVASWFDQEIKKFQGSHLKHVDIVLFPSDHRTITAFSGKFSQSNVIHAALPSCTVAQGDVTASNCDVIVNSTTNDFSLIGSPLSNMLVSKAGHSIITECQSNSIYSCPNYRVTSGGNLSCKYIVHVVPPGSASELTKILSSVLDMTDTTLQCCSIAIPAIGTGNAGLQTSQVAQAMQTAFQTFQATNPKQLKKIDVIIYDSQKLQTFQSFITTVTQQTAPSQPAQPAAAPKPSPRKVSFIPIEKRSPDEIQMYFCSKEKENIDEAWRRICAHVKEKSLRKVKDVDVDNLGAEEEREIMTLEKKHDVTVRRAQGTGKSTRLAISGIKDNVLEAYTSASEIIQEYKEALTCAEYVMWKYNDPRTNQLADFPLRTSLKIESAFKKDAQGKVSIQVLINNTTRNFHVDLAAMTETSVENNYTCAIVRSTKTSGESFPPEWEDMNGKPWKNFVVSSRSQEYQQILAIYRATGSIPRPVSLKRIQNPTLYHQFQAQKRKVEARMKAKGSPLPVSRDLFHGTSPDVCESIYKDGFDRSHCGKNATAFGKGVYFATTCQYSQGFAQRDAQGFSRMFLAEVITGEFHQGNSSLRTPNFMDATKKERYDSVVNTMTNPAMFVVFKDASVYPKYILKYQ